MYNRFIQTREKSETNISPNEKKWKQIEVITCHFEGNTKAQMK